VDVWEDLTVLWWCLVGCVCRLVVVGVCMAGYVGSWVVIWWMYGWMCR